MCDEHQRGTVARRNIVTEAMRQSQTVMSRIAKEFLPADQLKAIDRTFDPYQLTDNMFVKGALDGQHMIARQAWMNNTPKEVLNQVLEKSGNAESLVGEIKNRMNSGDYGIFDKLTPRNKAGFLNIMSHDPDVDPSSLSRAFSRMSPSEKNGMIDLLQVDNPDSLPDFLNNVAPAINQSFMEGINQENIAVMRRTYQSLADRATSAEEKGVYSKLVSYLDNYVEEKFKKVPSEAQPAQ